MSDTHQESLASAARQALQQAWDEILLLSEDGTLDNAVTDPLLREAVADSVGAKIKSYRYVLPTQLSAKVANQALDCRSIQERSNLQGAFDARSICDKVVVPFDRDHENVLGGAPEPYVNNPLRVPMISSTFREQQKDKRGWDDLCLVLDAVQDQQNAEFTRAIFRQTLIEIHRLLQQVTVRYPAPLRVSLDDCISAVESFLAESSGGDRPQAVVGALFHMLGERSRLYTSVQRGHINAADASSGQVADIECLDSNGALVLAVEVKDKQLKLRHLQDKIPGLRERHAPELLFFAFRGIDSNEASQISEITRKEFVSGQNIYIFEDVIPFFRIILALLGESGRASFLASVGSQLDEFRSDIANRRRWAAILSDL